MLLGSCLLENNEKNTRQLRAEIVIQAVNSNKHINDDDFDDYVYYDCDFDYDDDDYAYYGNDYESDYGLSPPPVYKSLTIFILTGQRLVAIPIPSVSYEL